MQIEVIAADAVWRLFSCRNCFVASWLDAPSLERMQKIEATGHALAARHPGGIAFLNVILDGMPRFSAEVRAEASRQSALSLPSRLATAHIIGIDGLRGVATRSFLSTVMLVSRPAVPTRVFAGIDEATPWLRERLAENEREPWSAAQLGELFAAARSPRG